MYRATLSRTAAAVACAAAMTVALTAPAANAAPQVVDNGGVTAISDPATRLDAQPGDVTPAPGVITMALAMPEDSWDTSLLLRFMGDMDAFLSTGNGTAEGAYTYGLDDDWTYSIDSNWVSRDGITRLTTDGGSPSIYTPEGVFIPVAAGRSSTYGDVTRQLYPIPRSKKILWGIDTSRNSCIFFCSGFQYRVEEAGDAKSITRTQDGDTVTLEADLERGSLTVVATPSTGDYEVTLTTSSEYSTDAQSVTATMVFPDATIDIPRGDTVATAEQTEIALAINSAAGLYFPIAVHGGWDNPTVKQMRKVAGKSVRDSYMTFTIAKKAEKGGLWRVKAKSRYNSRPIDFLYSPARGGNYFSAKY